MSSPDRVNGDVPRCSATTAAAEIGTDDTVLVSGFGSVGYPKAVPAELATSDRELSLTVVSGGSVGPEIDDELVTRGIVTRRFPYQSQDSSTAAANDGNLAYHDRHLSRVGDEARTGYYGSPDIALIEAIAVGEDWLVPSTSIGQVPAFVSAADRVIVEVNETVPEDVRAFHDVYRRDLPPDRTPLPLTEPGERIGSPRVAFDPKKLTAVVRSSRRDTPYEFRSPTETDEAIASNLLAFLDSEVDRNPALDQRLVLQFGVGSVGNALMEAVESFNLQDRELVYFGEVVQDGLLDALDSGVVKSASATSLALSSTGTERLFDDIDRYADRIVLRNTSVSNSPALIEQFGVVSVNTVAEVDVYGHANVTHIGGSRLLNGIGGGGDFTRNSLVGIVVLASTTADGEISRIKPMVPHVDYTEHDFSIIITEQGVADLRGLSPRERATEIIDSCAHPHYRDELRAYLDRARDGGGHVPHDEETAFSWRSEE